MNFKVGDYVTRNSHNNDIVFKIINIVQNIVYLQGVNVRLCADSSFDDLVLYHDSLVDDDKEIIERNMRELDIDRDHYFYIPGKILHIDGDDDYLNRCMKFYQNMEYL